MKNLEILALCSLFLGLGAYHADANTITLVSTQKPKNENSVTLQSAAAVVFGDPDIIDAFRAEPPSSLSGTNSFGTFSVKIIPNATTGPTESFTFSLNPGFVLAGIFVFGGNLGGNFYAVNDATAGSFAGLNAPLAGKSGKFAGLSHIDFFVEPSSRAVPDSGTTLIMLGGALIGLVGLRRHFINGD